jgi:hypothetical protein
MAERARWVAIVLACLAQLGVGCKGAPCIRHSDCDPGLVCSPTGVCLTPAVPDGGETTDAATDGAEDAPDDAAPDAADDAMVDAADDAMVDAATDAMVDAAIDAAGSVLEAPFAAAGTLSIDPTPGPSPRGEVP